jgi:phage terminase Nu1 subunit (DNA packaging protein)
MSEVNRASLASTFGCALTTVDAWVKEGCPAQKKGREYAFETAEVHKWLVKRAVAESRRRGNRFGGGSAPEGEMSLEEAKRRKEAALAKSAEIDLAEKIGMVAPIATMLKVIGEEIANARARLLAIPTKFRPTAQITARDESSARKAVSEVDNLIREALSEIKSYGAGQ